MSETGQATAIAHPIQGLIKYHGMRFPDQRMPYHDSISVCTAPSQTITTVRFDDDLTEDSFEVDGTILTGRGADRVRAVVDRVRDLAGIEQYVQLASESNFPTNVGLGSSSSGFAAAAMACVEAAGLERTRPEISTIARLGSSSAARAVTGGFSHLRTGRNDRDCRSERIETTIGDDLSIVIGLVPAYKETEAAHEEAAESHMFQARMAHIHGQISDMRDGLHRGDFDTVFELAEHDSLSLAATTMTGPAGWVYWKPETLAIFDTVRSLRSEDEIPAYFSTDTGATVYVNTRAEYTDIVADAVRSCGVETMEWEVGGPARIVDGADLL